MNTYGLNIHLYSFYLNRDIVRSGDKIRVSITSIPEEYKEAFTVECKKSNDVHHFFTINVTNQTKKIIFVFRRKSFLDNDPIVASTIIHSSELPQSETDQNNTELKTINIYEPLQQRHISADNRRVFGQMKIQFSPTNAFSSNACSKNEHQLKMVTLATTNKAYAGYGHVPNENENRQLAYAKYNGQDLFADIDPEQLKNLEELKDINKFEIQQNDQNQNELNNQQPQNQYQPQTQNQYQPQPQNQYQTQPQNQYQPQPQNQYQTQPQNQYQPQPQNMVFVNDLI